jgi:NADH:ubiquinone oxidoreductase subunit E
MKNIETPELLELIERYDDYFGTPGQIELMSCLKDLQQAYGFVPRISYPLLENHFQTSSKIIVSLIKRLPALLEEGGPHTLLVCSGQRCTDKGSAQFITEIEQLLGCKVGGVSKDGMFELRTQNCLRRCAQGKNLNIDTDPYTEMDIDKLKKVIETMKKG